MLIFREMRVKIVAAHKNGSNFAVLKKTTCLFVCAQNNHLFTLSQTFSNLKQKCWSSLVKRQGFLLKIYLHKYK